MKQFIFSSILLFSTCGCFAQQNWFTLYQDSTELMKDAKDLTTLFESDIKKFRPNIKFSMKAVVNTTPYLIYYDDRNFTANLPLWEQVIPQQKNFFYEVAGNESEGKRAFGLFFNGFYLPHELAHAFQDATSDSAIGVSYKNEYLANTIAILWWRKHNRIEDLNSCYLYAKKIWSNLPNPVFKDMNEEVYFTKNYEEASQNPYTYGYMQFKQFIEIYEDKSIPEFDIFIKKYLAR